MTVLKLVAFNVTLLSPIAQFALTLLFVLNVIQLSIYKMITNHAILNVPKVVFSKMLNA